MANTTRSSAGCDACRRRKKKCDEGKPQCAACVRLDILCETTRPRFKFVGNAAETVTAEVQGTQRASRRSGPLIYHRTKADGRKFRCDKPWSPSPIFVGSGNRASDLDMPLASDHGRYDAESPTAEQHPRSSSQPEVHPECPTPQVRKADSLWLGSPGAPVSDRSLLALPTANSQAVNPESLDFYHTPVGSSQSEDSLPLSTSETMKDLPQATVDDSAEYLVAWLSSFVDMGTAMASATPDDGLPVTRTEESFTQLQEQLYLHHWRSDLLRVLPAQFAQGEDLTAMCSALRPAIIALSACDLAQTRIDVRLWTIEQEKRWLLSPNAEHQHCGKMYYNQARHELAQMDYGKQEPTSLIATLMIFAYIESHIGTFRGAAFHHHGIEHLLSARQGFSGQSPLARDLTRVWTSLRAQNWRYRIPFTVPDFQRSLADLGVDNEQLLHPSDARDEAVMVNMLQSWRLSLMILFERYTGRGDMESISSRCCRDYCARISLSKATQPWTPKEPIPDEDYEALLADQRIELDRWHAAVPPSLLPREVLGLENGTQDPLQLGQPPLQFLSHQAAMNYVYFVAAQIFQSSEGMNEFLAPPYPSPQHSAHPGHLGVDHWLRLLLRIIAGLDVMTCARHSSYSLGILEILHMCHLRLPRQSHMIRNGVSYMTTAYTSNCITHEGTGLVLGFQHIFDEIEEQRSLGRDVFYTVPRFSPDCERQLTYDDMKPYVVYGRDKTTGKLFCQCLPPSPKVP